MNRRTFIFEKRLEMINLRLSRFEKESLSPDEQSEKEKLLKMKETMEKMIERFGE